MFEALRFTSQFGNAPQGKPRDPSEPMRLLVMGDFGGSRETPVESRKLHRVDVDNFDEVLESLRPTIVIPTGVGSEPMRLEITEMEHFHPDHLVEVLPEFEDLKSVRISLQHPKTFEAAAKQLREMVPGFDGGTEDSPAAGLVDSAAETVPEESNADLFERVLGQTSVQNELGRNASGDRTCQTSIDRLIHSIVAPYIEPKQDPRQDDYVSAVDSAISGHLREILHHPRFQSLEANWRGLEALVRKVTLSVNVQLYVLDATAEELAAATQSDDSIEQSLLLKRLVHDRDQQPWSLIVSTMEFGNRADELILLANLGAIAAFAGCPFIACASPTLVGTFDWTDDIQTVENTLTADQENWESLRLNPVANFIALVGPRVFARLPYGAATDPVEAFEFEEIPDPINSHDAFLWGPPSLAVAGLIGKSFLDRGWAMSLEDQCELSSLPAYTYKVDGEVELKPCAEAYLSERLADHLAQQGILPLVSFKNRDAARLYRYQSIANPASSLRGPWNN
ncbi:type VI secretion system contractile sheath domain-containing protein [Rhodopirellula sp. MGV]|uniref:type VI secretion system contractile sheath domain-containing protein n=1 Tax=Rhodopirellula sp. MGV TaxID=2023130 RepID=UPI000B969C23|nr:type VI secretion system contractile sheath large subunit [Rhodopirellula sp. MGV]OYP36389.1 hypothetical protein CGZ80_08760 [Rhodopirellula sp. MGV]PNY38377.1 hypothetical protein C2E31_00015 [Rhodopirellula baltica]